MIDRPGMPCAFPFATGELVSVLGSPRIEAFVVEFSDGSLMSIEAGTNILQIIREDAPIDPEALHITFHVIYVPEMPSYQPMKAFQKESFL